MYRVSSAMGQDNFNYHNRLNELNRNNVQSQMFSNSRITQLRDDPAGAAQSMRMQSKATRLERYDGNINNAINTYAVAEGYMAQAVEMMQRIRELAIQGANGTYSQEETNYMAQEVDQLLHELVLVANGKDGNGLSLFSGTRTDADAFRVVMGNVAGVGSQVITAVEYTGNSASRLTQYNDGATIESSFAGNSVFWAENQQWWGANGTDGFVVQADSSIIIDNTEIDLKAGDSIYSVVGKINNANIAVVASLDPVQNSLVLSTTVPHQIWLDDGVGSVLADLGMINQMSKAPNNLASDSATYGGSLFDMVIQLRDAMVAGDQEKIGGLALGGIDRAFEALSIQRTELGSRDNRLQYALARTQYEAESYKRWDDSVRGLNFVDATSELNNLDLVLRSSYAVGAKVLQPTLMDFMR